MKTKKCPACNNSELQYVYYGYSSMILFKRIECKKCGASGPWLTMTNDNAISYWKDINDKTDYQYVMQRISTEDVSEILN